MSDEHSYRYTVHKQEGYYSYSELFRKKFPDGYTCDSSGRVTPTTARTINLNDLMRTMVSKDESAYHENAWMWDGDFRFLDNQPTGEKGRVGFTSFMRSGNSFLRRYVEQITGVTTGSTISLHSATSLQVQGLKGEGHLDDRVWISKSHHPIIIPTSAFEAKKTFVAVRHPLDVFPSCAAMFGTISHGNKLDYEYHTEYPEHWNWWVHDQVERMKMFFDTLIEQCKRKGHQLYFVRYEDLVSDPKETLMGLMSFLLEESDLVGSNAERRICQVISKGSKGAATYKLKDTTGKFDQHQAKYTPEQLQYIQETLKEYIYYFGYANVEGNPTGFFKYDEHAPEDLERHDQFRRDSAASIDTLVSQDSVKGTLVHNVDDAYPMTPEFLAKVMEPSLEHARKTIEAARQSKNETQ